MASRSPRRCPPSSTWSADPSRSTTVRPTAILHLGFYDESAETFVEGIHKLRPGSIMVLDVATGRLSDQERWWWPSVEERRDLSFDQAAEQLRGLVLDSVRLHLRSDVPLGTALSGGIDSSVIVGAMRHVAARCRPAHVLLHRAQLTGRRGAVGRPHERPRRRCPAQGGGDARGDAARPRRRGPCPGRAVCQHEHLCPVPRVPCCARGRHHRDARRSGRRRAPAPATRATRATASAAFSPRAASATSHASSAAGPASPAGRRPRSPWPSPRRPYPVVPATVSGSPRRAAG